MFTRFHLDTCFDALLEHDVHNLGVFKARYRRSKYFGFVCGGMFQCSLIIWLRFGLVLDKKDRFGEPLT